MRYDKRLVLETVPKIEKYNPKLGRKEVIQKAKEVSVPCHISPLSVERSQEVFGDYRRNYLLVRCKNKVDTKQEVVKVDGDEYRVVKMQRFRAQTVFYLELMT